MDNIWENYSIEGVDKLKRDFRKQVATMVKLDRALECMRGRVCEICYACTKLIVALEDAVGKTEE